MYIIRGKVKSKKSTHKKKFKYFQRAQNSHLLRIALTIWPIMKTGDVNKMIWAQSMAVNGTQLNNGEQNCTRAICPMPITNSTVQKTRLSSMLLNAHFPVANDLAFNIFQNCRNTKTLKKTAISCGLMLGLMPRTSTRPPLASRMK